MRHRRIWVERIDGAVQHPDECRERGAWCAECHCCEHCFHDCACEACDCWSIQGQTPPVLRVERDVT